MLGDDGVIVLDVGVIDVRCCVDEYECVGVSYELGVMV